MKLSIISSPYDSGYLNQRTGAGPTHLLESGLVGDLTDAGHQVDSVRVELGSGIQPEVGAAAELMRQISRATSKAIGKGCFPVVLSGNCNAAVGAVSGIGPAGTGVLWFDAHGDLNTPDTTASGFFDGMGYAMLLGAGWESLAATIPGFAPVPGSLAAIAGARDLDPPEVEHIRDWGMESFPPERLRSGESRQALEDFGRRCQRLYVHVDLDVLDPSVVKANSLAVPGGLTVSEVMAAISAAGQGAPIAGIGIASYDPAVDESNAGPAVGREILETLLADLEPSTPDL